MKRALFFFLVNIISQIPCWAQTNVFPASGNVGIGTINPTINLHIEKNSNSYLRVNHTSGADTYFGSEPEYGLVSVFNNKGLEFRTNNLQRLVISNNGTATFSNNVFSGGFFNGSSYFSNGNIFLFGTGASGAGGKLKITSANYGFSFEKPNDDLSFLLRRDDLGNNTLQSWDGVGNTTVAGTLSASSLISSNYMQGQQLYLLNGTGGAKVTITGNNYGFAFEQPNDQPGMHLRRADGATNTLQSWDGTGNTTVAGTLSASSLISSNYMQGQQLYLLNGTGGAKVTITGNNYGFAFEQPSDQPGMHLRRADGATNTLQSWDGVGNSTIIGNLGIGTTASSDRLTVSGNIRAKKVIVSQSGWPDYVFDPNYQLRPLSELASFIQKNQHLPDMPSAKEVAEKGVSVGDNQALLLKKIEELTLYLIEMKKEIAELRSKSKQ